MPEAEFITIETLPKAIVIHILARDLGERNITAVRAGIARAAVQSPAETFILDMANIKFVPSLTLGALVELVDEFKARRQRLIFAGLQPTVKQLASITRLDRELEIVDDVDSALRSVGA